jgi:hypothetical protein
MQGETEFSARFLFIVDGGIPATAETLLGPIAATFLIPGCNASGFNIRTIKISSQGHSKP